MPCDNLVGVKNILITFRDCDTDEVIGPLSHELSTEELPMVKTCDIVNETMTNGFIRRTSANASIMMNVIRDLGIPLAWYQGCAALDIQIEYLNGLVYTGLGGSAIGDERSDTHDVTIEASFETLDEMLPGTQRSAA